jgi:hypothetical protein
MPENLMSVPLELFTSPEFYPLQAKFDRNAFLFVRMSRTDYQHFTFLATDFVDTQTNSTLEIRIDDLLLASAGTRLVLKPVLYIFHMAYCCSTLLARYFELLPLCFVLKEPQLLAEFALAPRQWDARWNEGFDLCIRLLSRTYNSYEVPVIKVNVPCNALGDRLLRDNPQATIIFLKAPLRIFVLAALKSQIRRRRVRYWVTKLIEQASPNSQIANINPDQLTDSQVAVVFWLLNDDLSNQLISGPHSTRVTVLDSEHLADAPQEVLPGIFERCGFPLGNEEFKALIDHPSIRRHSKHPSRPYDAAARRQDLVSAEHSWGREALEGIEWACAQGMVGRSESRRAKY